MCSASCFPLDGDSLTKAGCSDSPLSTAWVTPTAGWEVVFGFVLFCFLNHGEVETSLELFFFFEWLGFGVVYSRKLVIMPQMMVLLPPSWAFPSHTGLLSAQAFVTCENWQAGTCFLTFLFRISLLVPSSVFPSLRF